jgi:phosphopantothenoylcysteine synthetase/decarboxylase
MLLAHALEKAGYDVICLRSSLATYPLYPSIMKVLPFTTNDDLAGLLEELSQGKPVAAIFHVAALCDYSVKKITTLDGQTLSAQKIPTSSGALQMILEPTSKVISKLRALFPSSIIVGWKYEVEGTKYEALTKAKHQIIKYQLDACVANGAVFLNKLEFISSFHKRESFDSKQSLVAFLVPWTHKIIAKK